MSRVLTLAFKDLKLLTRDRASLFWVFFWPLGFGIFFGSLMGGMGEHGPRGMSVAVIDEDHSDASRALIDKLKHSEALSVRDTIPLLAAEDRVRRGSLVAYVRVLPGFEKASGFRRSDSTAIEIGIDPSRRAERGILEGLVTEASFAGLQQMFAKPDRMRASVNESLRDVDSSNTLPPDQKANIRRFLSSLDEYLGNVDTAVYRKGGGEFAGPQITAKPVLQAATGPRTAFEISFPSAILWALLGCTSGFAQSLVTERTLGTYLRLRASPLSRSQVLLGKGLASYLAGLAIIVALLAIGGTFLGVRLDHPGQLAAAVLATPFCFTGLTLLFANLGKTERAVGGASWAIMLVMSMTGGGMIPLIAMPPWMQRASNVSPVKWGIFGLEGAIWRGFSPAEMVLPCAILVGVGILGIALGWILSGRQEA
ncbi:MAG TPA: ABC transporter permease [Candidatus Eisenbacteria bacterium]|nr:ABC transporter permease [Candidatus Eisenbacteria bacterium]